MYIALVIQLLAASCDFNKNNNHFFLDSIRLLQNEFKCRQKKKTPAALW